MFGTPKTVAQALAPFKKAISDLNIVADHQQQTVDTALMKIADARKAAEQIEIVQGAIADDAKREAGTASALARRIASLLEDEPAPAIEPAKED